MDTETLISHLRLIRSHRVGPSTYYRLLNEYGSVEAAVEALPYVAKQAGVADYQSFTRDAARFELDRGCVLGAELLIFGAQNYPEKLAEVENPPPALWCMGDTRIFKPPSIALVGARNASALGLRMAERLAVDLGRYGYIIVSGLARGIDQAAHKGSLRVGTIGVSACGIDVTYPPEAKPIYEKIMENGAILTEAPLGTAPHQKLFPRRNRIIAGLAEAVVVIEAASKSGSISTANAALDFGRDVMAVPNHPSDARAGGCNILIRDGATLIRNAADIHEMVKTSLDESFVKEQMPCEVYDSRKLEERVLALLSHSPIQEDFLTQQTKTSPAMMSALLLRLELQDRVKRDPFGNISLI